MQDAFVLCAHLLKGSAPDPLGTLSERYYSLRPSVSEEEVTGQKSSFNLKAEDRTQNGVGTSPPTRVPATLTRSAPPVPQSGGRGADNCPAPLRPPRRPLAGLKDAGRCPFEWELLELGRRRRGGERWRLAARRDP